MALFPLLMVWHVCPLSTSSQGVQIGSLAWNVFRFLPIKQTLLHAKKAQPNTNTIVSKKAQLADSSPFSSIAGWCAAQNASTLIGRYVSLNYRGIGCCPFGEHHQQSEDTRESFRVYPPSANGNCWYCYVWQRGGNVFDFLSLYHNIDARTLWTRIRAGESF